MNESSPQDWKQTGPFIQGIRMDAKTLLGRQVNPQTSENAVHRSIYSFLERERREKVCDNFSLFAVSIVMVVVDGISFIFRIVTILHEIITYTSIQIEGVPFRMS